MTAAGAVRHGVAIPTGWLARSRGPTLLDIAVGLERLGFDTLWLSELESDPAPGRDALAICSAIGVVTSRIQLMALLDPGSRLPTVTAKAASGTDRMCGGRLGLGLVEGEGIDEVRATLDGRGPPNLPEPIGSVPLWVVGAPGRAVGAAAGCFLGWNHGADWVVQAVHRLEEECDAQGRDPRSIRVAVGAMVGPERSAEDALLSAPDRAREWVAEMVGVGVTDLVMSFASRPFGWRDDSVAEVWANEVLGLATTDGGYAGGERSQR